MKPTRRLFIEYWILRNGKPYRKFPTKAAAQHFLIMARQTRQLTKRDYRLKTFVKFELA